ncbi:MAG: hypothetical protein ABJA11_01640 [Pseudolysinimonas sp.]
MTIPKWLLPVICVVAALAVGVAATLIGMRFATRTPTVALKTESVPILAPTGPTATDTGTDPYAVSGAVGSATIVTPGQKGATRVDSGAQARIDGYNAPGLIDPAVAVGTPTPAPASGSSDSGGAPLPADDPCATATPPSSCPAGVSSTVLADTHDAPALTAITRANPPLTSVGSSIFCPAGDLARGEAWVDVMTNTPGTADLTYSAIGHSTDTGTAHATTDATQAADFASYHSRTGGYRENYWAFQHCAKLTGLDPTRRYLVSAIFTDTLSRVIGPMLANLDPRGRPTVPPIHAIPVGNGLLYVSIPSPTMTTGVRPIIYAWSPGAGDTSNCSEYGQHPDIHAIQDPVVVEVSADELDRQNYDSAYRSRDVRIYSVPEGTTVMICARWFDAHAPSWNVTTPTHQASIEVSSPDAITPILTLHSLELAKQVDANKLQIAVATPTGVACGSWFGPAAAAGPGSVPIGQTLCNVGTSGAGFEGRLSVTTVVNTGTAAAMTRTSLLQLQRQSCTGVCSLPPTMRYRIDLPTVTVATGLCGGGFPWDGPCTPPSEQVSLGSAVIDVSWAQGLTPGNAHWLVGDTDDTLPTATPLAGPQLNTDTEGVPSLSADRLTGAVNFDIQTSEAAHWTATISGDCLPAGYQHTQSGQTIGAGETPHMVLAWTHLCPGWQYQMAVSLTDDAGITTTWAIVGAQHRWVNALFGTPSPRVQVTGTLYTGPQNAIHEAYGIHQVQISIDGASQYPTPSRPCTAASDRTGTAIPLSFDMAETPTVHLVITDTVIQANHSTAPTGGPASQCGFDRAEYAFIVWEGDVRMQDLLAYGVSFGSTVTGQTTYRSDTWTGFQRSDWTIGGNARAVELPLG